MTPTVHSIAFTIVLVAIHLQLSRTQNTANPADDWTTSGSYHIAYCNANNSTVQHPQAAYLQALLPIVWSYIQDLLQDIVLGTTSTHGYAAFFKTNTNLETIRRIFQDIADGPDILTGVWNTTTETFISPLKWTPPVLLCVKPGDVDTINGQEACESTDEHIILATVPKKTGIVYLCPSFFELPVESQNSACPSVDPATNTFTDRGWNLGGTQYAVLVHEMVHVYNEREVGSGGEVYRIQESVELSAEMSLRNPMNFAFYAAAVRAGCTDFPEVVPDGNWCRGRCVGSDNGTVSMLDNSTTENDTRATR